MGGGCWGLAVCWRPFVWGVVQTPFIFRGTSACVADVLYLFVHAAAVVTCLQYSAVLHARARAALMPTPEVYVPPLQATTVLSRLLWPPWENEPVFCTLRSRKQVELYT